MDEFSILKGKKFLILGHGRHGKDEIARIIQEKVGNSFISSSLFAMDLIVQDTLEVVYGISYSSPEACFEDRHTKRELWRDIIKDYCTPDRTKLTKELLSQYDMYVGKRSLEEYIATRDLYDYIIFVSAYPRVEYIDPTMEIVYDDEMFHISNHGTIPELEESVGDLLRTLTEKEIKDESD